MPVFINDVQWLSQAKVIPSTGYPDKEESWHNLNQGATGLEKQQAWCRDSVLSALK